MFRFKNGAEVAMGQQMARFEQEDLLEELSIDDSKKFLNGKSIDEKRSFRA